MLFSNFVFVDMSRGFGSQKVEGIGRGMMFNGGMIGRGKPSLPPGFIVPKMNTE